MKKLLLCTLTCTLFLTSFAAPKRYKLLTSTTNWSNSANWMPAGLPGDGDTIFIPENIQLTLANDLTLKNVYFDLYGSMILSGLNMKLILQNLSTFNVHTSGWIDGSKASQQIVLGSIIFKGNAPLLTGPKIATSSSNGFVTYYEPVILPVTFQSFNVSRSYTNSLLQWTASEPANSGYYEVQRSNNGTAWTSIATYFAAGNATASYSYTDKSGAAGVVYYRIKHVNADGTCNYTMVRTLNGANATMPVVISVPGHIKIVFPQAIKGKVLIEIIGINGSVLRQQMASSLSGDVQLATSGLKGFYMLHISDGQNFNTTWQLIL